MADSRNAGRPLSPHLQVYKKSLTMTLSIVHRITGVALSAGTLLLVWWLTAAATSDQYFDLVQAVFGSWIDNAQCARHAEVDDDMMIFF